MIIDLGNRMQSPVQKRLYRFMQPLLNKALGFEQLAAIYARAKALHEGHAASGSLFGWLDAVLTAVGHTYQANAAEGFEVPADGPLIIVANHPFGLLDPIVLGHFLAQRRPDLKIMANSLMGDVEEMKPYLIQVNVFGSREAARENIGAMKEAVEHVKGGGALLMFPSGEVAHYRPGRGVEESPWTNHVGRIVRRTQASVLPVFFPGRNSLMFQASGLINKRLRTGLIVREFVDAKSRSTLMHVGSLLPFKKLKRLENDEALTLHLRICCLMLGRRKAQSPCLVNVDVGEAAVVEGPDSSLMQGEVDRLRAHGGLLASQGTLCAFVAECSAIPHVLHEIGRQREMTFRAAGEGTGAAIDLDRFDRYYLHIFLWDEEQRAVAGAYRLGRADQILRDHGAGGLYTNTLFKFRRPFLRHLHDAVEMGRSYVAEAYQRDMAALPLLWKAVIVWIGQNPQYRKLFGPVSISKDYDPHSQRIMVDYLSSRHGDDAMDGFVRPRRPFKSNKSSGLMRDLVSLKLADADDCSAMVSNLEPDGKGIPVLLKHYLRLNGTILSFNVDAAFSNVLDGLIMVDMLKTDARLPSRMMGPAAWAAYLAHHRQQS